MLGRLGRPLHAFRTETGRDVVVRETERGIVHYLPSYYVPAPLPEVGADFPAGEPWNTRVLVKGWHGLLWTDLPSGARLQYSIDSTLVWPFKGTAEDMPPALFRGSGFVVFRRFMKPWEVVGPIVYGGCLAYWLVALMLLHRRYAGPKLKGMVGHSYVLSVVVAAVLLAFRYVPLALQLNWLGAGVPVPDRWTASVPLQVAFVVTVFLLYAYQGGLAAWGFPPLLLGAGQARASAFTARLWAIGHRPWVRVPLAVVLVLFWFCAVMIAGVAW